MAGHGFFCVLICTLVLFAGNTTAVQNQVVEGAPEDGVVESILAEVGRNPELILGPLRDTRFVCRDFPRTRRQPPFSIDDLPDTKSNECRGCSLMLKTLDTLVNRRGCEYEDLKPALMVACYALVTIKGFKPEEMCETALDNYGSAVIEISKKNKKSPTDSCYFLNLCLSDDIVNAVPEYPTPMQRPKPGRPQPREDDQKHVDEVVDRWRQRAGVLMGGEETRVKRDVENDPDVFRVVQFTDIHVDEEYAVGSATDCGLPLCCRDYYTGTGSAGDNGEYACNVPPSTTLKFMNKMADLEPDVVFYSGDSPSHHLWRETMWGMYNSTLYVADMLNEAFPEAPIYSTIGNHETFPTNMYYPGGREETSIFHEVFIDAYGDLGALGEDQETTIRRGGYYTVLIRPGLRLMAYNSNYGYTDNWYNLLNLEEDIYSDMKTFMTDTLQLARENDEQVLLMTHHPSGSGILDYDNDIKEILLPYSDVIKLNVVGHVHKESFRLFRDPSDGGKAKLVQILSQSTNTYKSVNPGARIYFFDNETMELLDYHQYYLNIGGTNDADSPVVLAYKMKEEYSMDSLEPSAWQDLTNRMTTDDVLFNKYWYNRQTRNAENGKCSGACRTRAICEVDSAVLDEFYACMNAANDDGCDNDDGGKDGDGDGDHDTDDNNEDKDKDNGASTVAIKPAMLWTVLFGVYYLISSQRL